MDTKENTLGEVPFGMRLLSIGGEEEQRRGRGAAGEGTIIADIGPQPRLPGSTARQQRH